MPQSVVPGGPVNARLRQKSMARVTNCDSQLSQSALGGNTNSLMIAIDQTPDTNSESRRLADNLLPPAADVFCAREQRIYRRADRTREITYDEKDQMQQLIDLYLVETAPIWMASVKRSPDRCANWNSSAPRATSPGHTRCLPMFVRNFRAPRVPSRNLSKHCRPPIHNP